MPWLPTLPTAGSDHLRVRLGHAPDSPLLSLEDAMTTYPEPHCFNYPGCQSLIIERPRGHFAPWSSPFDCRASGCIHAWKGGWR